MRKVTPSGFDLHLKELLRKNPKLAEEYARQFAKLPLQTQLGILRRRQWLSQEVVARKLKAKQPSVARLERADHDPRLSSVEKQARAIRCRLVLIPESAYRKVAKLVAMDARNH